MGGEQAETGPEGKELERWVDRKAAELDVDRAEVVDRALAAYRVLDADGDALRSDEVDGLETELDDLDSRVSDLEADLDEKVTDLRERVIQVKREADRRAASSDDRSDAEGAGPAEAPDAVADLGESLSALESRVEGGFENYEEVVEYLVDAAEESDEKLDAVATAVVDLRRRLSERERADAERSASAELKRTANREGVARADCEACGESVAVALLTAPYCPHCGETFDGVRARGGLLPFGSATLTTGRRPALERPGETAESTDSAELAETAETAADPFEAPFVRNDSDDEETTSGASSEAASRARREAADPPEAGGD
ncbi:CopG family transcriptional regulator [Halogeometricum sp. S1BR25-6]|uniref:CopG family transcriptional regulator n=1 Tax=Halogeometricum salsisoli TaxID=2950536 RepID=A0ABU2GFB8_9EURY|nr:CopG family transcriptional regulator [Halogeometricum sp. S1BR25-6]MDS0299500.1 CopG family transcriptional regulator [Halogeometricum sp. S1BR25-6]